MKYQFQIEFTMSTVFVLYVVSLSLASLIFAIKTGEKLNYEVKKYYSLEARGGLKLMYLLSTIIFIQDLIVFVAFIVAVVLLPLYKHWQEIKHFFKGLKSGYDNLDKPDSVDYTYWWEFCAYSIIFPLCCFLNHVNYIIIAFVHDLYHATSAVVTYGILLVFCYSMLNEMTSIIHEFRNNWTIKSVGWKYLAFIQSILFVAVLLLIGYVALDVGLYFSLPINDAFQDAPNHFISIYQTSIIFLTALVSYVILLKPFRSPIHIFSKAIDNLLLKNENKSVLGIAKEKWKGWSKEEKDVEVAKSLVKKLSPLTGDYHKSTAILKQLAMDQNIKIVSIELVCAYT